MPDRSGCKPDKFLTLSYAPFELAYFDVWGPSPFLTKGRSKYYVSFVDGYTCYCWVYQRKIIIIFF